jgi:O-antigen/teichoic acid export membrane protein
VVSHGGSLALIDQAVVSATNFCTSLLIARVCGKAELGIYMLAWTVTMLVNEVLTAVILTPYNVISPTFDAAQQVRYRGSMVLHQLALSAVCSVCLICAAMQMVRFPDSTGLGRLLGLLAGLIVVLVFREFARRMYFAHLQMRTAVITDAVGSFLQLSLIAWMIRYRILNAPSAYIAIALASTVPGLVWLITYRHGFTVSFSTAVIDFRRNWHVAKCILGSGMLWAGAMYAYPWLLVWMHGISATGVWAACYGLVALSNPVLLGFGNYLGPKIAILHGRHGMPAMRSYVWRSCAMFAGLLTPLAVIAWFWGDPLVSHLYGAAFSGHTTAIRFLVVNVLIAGAAFPFSRGLFSIQRADLDLAVNVVAILFLFCFGLGLVHFYGVAGAAAGLMLTNGVTAILRVGIFDRVTRQKDHRAILFQDLNIPNDGDLC